MDENFQGKRLANGSAGLARRCRSIFRADLGDFGDRVFTGEYNQLGAEVASELHLSVRTVESHRSRILSKLDLKTRAELVRYAIDSGIFDPSQPPKTD